MNTPALPIQQLQHLDQPEKLEQLQRMGQSLWLDSLSRGLLRSGTLARYIRDLSISGVSCNINALSQALVAEDSYRDSILVLDAAGFSAEEIFYALAIQDSTEAADLFRPLFDDSLGLDGWVSMAVSPILADTTTKIVQTAIKLLGEAEKSNLLIQLYGTAEGLAASEELTFNGIAVNVALLFSSEQYLATAESYMRGLERRLSAGLDLTQTSLASVASVCVSPWDVDVNLELTSPFHQRLGIAMAIRTYHAHCTLQLSQRWRQLASAGARPQRLLWSNTGSQSGAGDDTLYIQSLVAAGTINALPKASLLAFVEHGKVGTAMPADGGYADAVLEEFRREGIAATELASCLQERAVATAVTSWHSALSTIRETAESMRNRPPDAVI